MQVSVQNQAIQSIEADALVVNLFEGVTRPSGATGAVDAALGGQITSIIATGDLKGKLGEVLTLYSRGATGAPRVIVVGLGKSEGFGLEQARRAAATAARHAAKLGVKRLVTIAHGAGIGGLDPAAAAQATVEGTFLGTYRFDQFKSAPSEPMPEIAELVVAEVAEGQLDAVRLGAAIGEAVAGGVAVSRDLSNRPSNDLTPTQLGREAEALAGRHGMQAEIWDEARIKSEGMGSLASVSQGSEEEARFIVLTHRPASAKNAKPYVIAGKAVTFDTGGISLKPGLKMGAMKFDMSGGAAVLGAMETIGRLQLPLYVVGLVGATENMPSGTATKPGDIVRALNGKTIEVLNTDAEGRLVLADVLSYAQRLDPAACVDLATLTGAISIALGKHAAGLFSNDDTLSTELTSAGDKTGERLWRLPIWEEYGEMIKSEYADMKNVHDAPSSPAGSIFGAKFLEEFVTYPWAHLDIAAVAWDAKDLPYSPVGATGFGVRLLVEWLRGKV